MSARETVSVRNAWVSEGNTYPASPKGQDFSIHFSNSSEFMDYVEANPAKGSRSGSLDRGGNDWVDSKSFKEALKWGRDGNPKLTAKVLAARESMRIGLIPEEFTMIEELLPSGSVPDISTYLAGEECHMINYNSCQDTPIIKIAFSACFMAGINDETVHNYGAALMNLIDEIESTGAATVQLTTYGTLFNRFRGFKNKKMGSIFWSCEIKRAGEDMNEHEVAMFTSSSSHFRRFGFRLIETYPNREASEAQCSNSYGMKKENSKINHDDFLDEFDVIIPNIEHNESSENIREELHSRFLESEAVSALLRAGE